MGEFVCRVADADGRVFSHVEAANTLDEARQKLLDRGLYVYSVESRGGRLGSLVRRKTGRQVSGSDFLILNQQFNTLIKAGLPILRALDLLATRATSPKLRPVISQIRDQVREGKSLSEAVELSTAHARRQFEAVTTQAKELSALAQKVTAETTEPVKESLTKVFKKVA